MKQTPLYERHVALGGKIVDFGGWALPIQYQGIIEEHEAVRGAAGLFDVSHMGELLLQGPDALDNLQHLLTNDVGRTVIDQAVYSPMCAEDGGVIDDLLVYRLSGQTWLLVVNAANTEQDAAWIAAHLTGDAQFADVSAEYAQLAVQGPRAERILQRLTDEDLSGIRFYHFRQHVCCAGQDMLISRTGYTGEDGFELYLPAAEAPRIWERLLEAGRADGLLPAGLGARDTLRFEAALPLYGHELARDISPLEAGLGRFVKLDKPDFIGREALLRQRESGPTRKLVGLEMIGRGVARGHYEVRQGERAVGFVTSGSFAPTIRKNLAMALLAADQAADGTELDVVIRDKSVKARVIGLPFYNKKYAIKH
ncbi:MAG: glycine cleavage system aminomethyltransferase GcvT [Clostridiaceae bacterium]|nr:glycine cleavage system aminomethyltransferase GcvT [Clostridiaceae bacterium]